MPGEATTQEKIKLSDIMWVGYIYFLKSCTVQNRPPCNKIATTILKTTMLSKCKAVSRETLQLQKLVKLWKNSVFMKETQSEWHMNQIRHYSILMQVMVIPFLLYNWSNRHWQHLQSSGTFSVFLCICRNKNCQALLMKVEASEKTSNKFQKLNRF